MRKETDSLLFKPGELARKAECRQWSLPMGQLPHLMPRLVGDVGQIQVLIAAFYDSEHRLLLDVRVEASLPLRCERCLEQGVSQVTAESRLLVVRSDEQAAQNIEDFEPLILDDEGRLSVEEIASDELLLSLPTFYNHPEGECVEDLIDKYSDKAELEERIHPFANLGAMLSASE